MTRRFDRFDRIFLKPRVSSLTSARGFAISLVNLRFFVVGGPARSAAGGMRRSCEKPRVPCDKKT